MYSLKVLKELHHPDGRIFTPGHDCHELDAFEVAELIADYPKHFEAADEITKSLAEDGEKVKHLAAAVVRKRKEEGELKAVKK